MSRLEITEEEYAAATRVYELLRKTQVEGVHAPFRPVIPGLFPDYATWELGNVGATIPANPQAGTPELVIPDNSAFNAIMLQYISVLKKLRETSNTTQSVTFQNSWVNFGSGYKEARIWKDDLNMVRAEGLVKSGSSTIFNFPVGMRPSAGVFMSTVSNNVFGIIEVRADGNVVPIVYNNTHVSLEGICFRAVV